MHVYEVVGEVIFRRSGYRSVPVHCKVMRTRARILENGRVQISSLRSGYANVRMPEWFADWTDDDNMTGEFDGGRAIDIAVPVQSIELAMAGAKALPDVSGGENVDSFYGEFAAVLIDGHWVEPQVDNPLFMGMRAY